jgi:hypothetical protein
VIAVRVPPSPSRLLAPSAARGAQRWAYRDGRAMRHGILSGVFNHYPKPLAEVFSTTG